MSSGGDDSDDTLMRALARTDTPPWLAPGTMVQGRFVVLGIAGSGGMGAVYRARDRDGTPVALKISRTASGSTR